MGISFVDFRNILVIDLGQLGDVVQSLPALTSLRQKFPTSKITALVDKTPAAVVKLCGAVDEVIEIDRGELKRRPKSWSVFQLFRLVGTTRRSKFDLVIDLHSFYETNILGFLSGAKYRLFANRENRSLDFLSNFRPRPPLENKAAHVSSRYLDVLAPLGIENGRTKIELKPRRPDVDDVRLLWRENDLSEANRIIGLFPGAGHPSRQWDLAKFAALARRLLERSFNVVVFLGPEEAGWSEEVRTLFPPETRILSGLTIPQFIAAVPRLAAFVGNDTGPLHLAAAFDIPVLGLFDSRAPLTYKPLSDNLSLINSSRIDRITVGEVFEAVSKLLEPVPVRDRDVDLMGSARL